MVMWLIMLTRITNNDDDDNDDVDDADDDMFDNGDEDYQQARMSLVRNASSDHQVKSSLDCGSALL